MSKDLPRTVEPDGAIIISPDLWPGAGVSEDAGPSVVGREGVIDDIFTALFSGGRVQLVPEEGAGPGIGLRTAAHEFLRRRQGDYVLIWRLRGDNNAALTYSFASIAAALGFAEEILESTVRKVDAVKKWLGENRGWVLLFEDLQSPKTLTRFLPEMDTGHVIVTTGPKLKLKGFERLALGPLDAKGTAAYLSQTVHVLDAEALQPVARRMEGTPLHLSLFAALLNFSKLPLADALKKIKEAGKRMSMDSKAIDAGGAGTTEALVMALLDIIPKDRLASLDLFALCTFFAPYEIPLSALRDGAPLLPSRLAPVASEEASLTEAAALLAELGLARLHNQELSFHPGVQQAMAALMDGKQQKVWAATALRVVAQSFPEEDEYSYEIPACTKMVDHALTVSAHVGRLGLVSEEAGALHNQVGQYLHATGESGASAKCFHYAVNLAVRAFGENHANVATRLNNLGVVLQDLGQLDEARACYQRAFDICETLYGPAHEAAYGPAHESMLTKPVYNLCAVLEEMGKTKEALETYGRAMNIYLEVFSWSHPAVAECAYNLGNLWRGMDRTLKAKECFEKAIFAEESTSEGREETLALYLNALGAAHLDLDEPAEGLARFERAMELDLAVLGPDHETVARDLGNMGQAYLLQEKYGDAIDAYEKAFQIVEAKGQGDSEEGVLLLNHLGVTCHANGEKKKAAAYFERVIAIREERVGADAPELVKDLVNLAGSYEAIDEFEKAESLLRRALAIKDDSDDGDEEGVAKLCVRLGHLVRVQDRFAEALEQYERAYNIDRGIHGEDHPDVARDTYYIGRALAASGDSIVAAAHLSRALRMYEEHYGKDHPRTRRVKSKLEEIHE